MKSVKGWKTEILARLDRGHTLLAAMSKLGVKQSTLLTEKRLDPEFKAQLDSRGNH